MTNEYENATPLDIQLSSGWPEVDAVVDAIFAECVADAGIQRQYPRMKTCLKVVLMNLFTCHVSDPTRYIRYSRRNASFTKSYNCLELSPEQIRKAVDNLAKLKYVTGELGKWSFIAEGRRQSRVRAEQSLIQRIMEFRVSPLMAAIDPDANLIVLKDSDKNWLEIEPTNVTHRMQEELKRINAILSVTMINLYMTDKELHVLNERLRTGKIPKYDGGCDEEQDEEDVGEKPRGKIDFTKKTLRRVFNDSLFDHGGRLYGGWWQRIPSADRKYIRINRMNTAEVDFSSIHINLIYWLEGLPLPEGDLYSLDGFPEGTRAVVKKCLLTIINSKDREEAMASIRQRIRGYKYKSEKINGLWDKKKIEFNEKDRITLPAGVKSIDMIIKAFEKKHLAITDWFFSRKGVELQFWDSQIAVEILLMLEKEGVPALPLHDSFIVAEPQEKGLRKVMSDAFYKITGRVPRMDAKDSLTEQNIEKGEDVMEAHYQAKMDNGKGYTPWFRDKYSVYVNSLEDWKKVHKRDNTFFYDRGRLLNKEVY